MSLEISLILILEQQISHSRRRMAIAKRRAEIHLTPVEMKVLHPTEAEEVQRVQAWMEEQTIEENLNLDKEETRKHQEVLTLCSIIKGKWTNLEIH